MIGPAAPFPEPPPAPARTGLPRWAIALIAALGGLLIGGLGGFAGGGWFVRETRVERDFEMIVFLEQGIDEAQRVAVRDAVDRAAPDEVDFRTREENFELYKKTKPDDELLRQLRPEAFSETFVYRTHGGGPECGPVAGLRKLPGVRDVAIHMPADGARLEGNLICPT
jgi:hypothetical protein